MDAAALLCVILDLSPKPWYQSSTAQNEQSLSFRSFLSQVLAFLNSHMASKPENALGVFGALPGRSVVLYSSTEPPGELPHCVPDANTYHPFKTMNTAITERVMVELRSLTDVDEDAPSQLVGAMAKALCYINRIVNPSSTIPQGPATPRDPRILILSVSPDLSSSYIPLMNSIFSAQKLKVTIDVCKIFGPDAVFLQQAAHLTGGSYVFPERREALLQQLTMTFLPSPSIRKLMAVPTQETIDYRAVCFCHKKIVDIGFVCSVCLSIFCQPIPVCSTCRTKFPIKTLQRLNASRPLTLPIAKPTGSESVPNGAHETKSTLPPP